MSVQASLDSSAPTNLIHHDSRDSMRTKSAPLQGKQATWPNNVAKASLPGLQNAAPTSIRELYSEWCVSVRMHAQASALSAVPPALAQRASLSAKALTSNNSAVTAFKGPKPLLKAVPGEEGLREVCRENFSMYSDRLWLDQLSLRRCCVVKVSTLHSDCAVSDYSALCLIRTCLS